MNKDIRLQHKIGGINRCSPEIVQQLRRRMANLRHRRLKIDAVIQEFFPEFAKEQVFPGIYIVPKKVAKYIKNEAWPMYRFKWMVPPQWMEWSVLNGTLGQSEIISESERFGSRPLMVLGLPTGLKKNVKEHLLSVITDFYNA